MAHLVFSFRKCQIFFIYDALMVANKLFSVKQQGFWKTNRNFPVGQEVILTPQDNFQIRIFFRNVKISWKIIFF